MKSMLDMAWTPVPSGGLDDLDHVRWKWIKAWANSRPEDLHQ